MATQHDPKKPEPHAESHAHGAKAGSIESTQSELDDAKAELAKALPEIEEEAGKARRQLERIEAAKKKWALTHEPEDQFDPNQFEPPMVPLKQDPKKQKEFHALHYKIAKLEADLAAATRSVIG